MKTCASFFIPSRTVCLSTLALLLACHSALAADARTTQDAPKPQAAEEARKRDRDRAERNLQLLKEEFVRIDQEVRTKRQELDGLREHLGLSDEEITAGSSNSPAADSMRILERHALETDMKWREIESLQGQLEKMSRKDLKRALPTACPDPVLTSLLQNEATAEQKLVALLANLGEQNPEVRSAHKVLEKIKEQIEDRLEGILQGLKVRMQATQRTMDLIKKELDKTKQASIERSIMISPYFRAKWDLESREQIRDRLQLKIYQEEIDAALLEAR